MSTVWIILIIASLVFLVLIGVYNSLVRSKNRVKEAWSDIDVQLKRRYDLIPNLLNTVKGYARHENDVFEKVTQARAAAIGAHTVGEQSRAESGLQGALKSLFAVAEAYPQLRASENFQELQKELTDTEDKIQAARRFYNSNVLDLNTKLEQFPTNIIGGMFGFKMAEFFEIDESIQKEVPKVEF